MAAITESHQANTNSQVEQVFTVNVSNVKADKGGSSTQEDFGFATEICDEKGHRFSVIGVLDGHGLRGHEYSQEVGKAMQKAVETPGFVEKILRDPKTTGDELFQVGQDCAFKLFDARMKRAGIPYYTNEGQVTLASNTLDAKGGTTATVIFVERHGSIIVMNVGDTDAWMVTNSTQRKLTVDHQPTSISEHDRISRDFPESERAVSIFARSERTSPHPKGDIYFNNKEFGGYSVKNVDHEPATYMQYVHVGEIHKLAMTRSIGDLVMRRGGIISEPSVSQIQIEDDAVVLIATDGYWDNIVSSNITSMIDILVSRHGLDQVDQIASRWFDAIEKAAIKNFGPSRDNMLGYVITIKKG